MTCHAKLMKMYRKAARGKLFDVAAAPVLLLSGGVMAVIGVVVRESRRKKRVRMQTINSFWCPTAENDRIRVRCRMQAQEARQRELGSWRIPSCV